MFICDHAEGCELDEGYTCLHKVPHEWMGKGKDWKECEVGHWCAPYPTECPMVIYEVECMEI